MRLTHLLRPAALALCALLACAARAADLRVGLIGLDTSHVIAFTKALNDPVNKDHVPGAKVVAVFKGGSPDIAASATRVEGFTAELLKDPNIKLYATIAELARNVDAIMIEAVDGRPHLAQFKEVLSAGKPVFIDKPVAGSLRDAVEIFRLAKEHKIPVFSSSSLRFNALAALKGAKYGDLHGAFAYGPASLEPTHPDLFWYGIHAVETLYTVMGTGCQTVTRTQTANTEIVTGTWADGRVGTMRGNRNSKGAYGLTVFGSTAVVAPELKTGYGALLKEIVAFFKSGVPPVSAEETIELFTFMEAADESKRRGGAPVALADVLKANQPKK
jgi:hypothetical protein